LTTVHVDKGVLHIQLVLSDDDQNKLTT